VTGALPELLQTMVELGGSDLHLSVGAAPVVRVDGRLRRLERPVLTPGEIEALCYGLLSPSERDAFEATNELDVAIGLPDVGRFRCNLFRQRGVVGAVYRLIPDAVRSVEALGLPPVVGQLADRPRGLVLVTGPTGSGKSTTLAAMVDRINETRPVHILTIEDPVEYVHRHKAGIVNQREVHRDTRSVAGALRAALREDPDVVLVGEMRDLETMEAALTLAETGHLTFGTLHTNSATETVTRLINAFPAHRQAQVRTSLSLALEGVAAVEILVATHAVRHLIRDDKTHQIYGVMQAGQDTHGMQTFNQSLARLVERGEVAREIALAASSNPDELARLLSRHGPPGAVAADARRRPQTAAP
jgi:twitching motility protein PilT